MSFFLLDIIFNILMCVIINSNTGGKFMIESNTKEYNVYIDESGDEGINKGSKYFILTALIVDKEKDLEISKKLMKLKQI